MSSPTTVLAMALPSLTALIEREVVEPGWYESLYAAGSTDWMITYSDFVDMPELHEEVALCTRDNVMSLDQY